MKILKYVEKYENIKICREISKILKYVEKYQKY